MTDEIGLSEEIEIRKISIDHSWKWFELQANQRMMLFRYFILLNSGLVAINAALVVNNHIFFSSFICFFAGIISIIFYFMDRRVVGHITVGYNALEEDEKFLIKYTGNTNINLKHNSGTGANNITLQILSIFTLVAILYFLGGLVALFTNTNELVNILTELKQSPIGSLLAGAGWL